MQPPQVQASEDVERGAGAWIDLEHMPRPGRHQEVEAVEAAKARRGDQRVAPDDETFGEGRRNPRRRGTAAVTVRLAGRGIVPLLAEAEHARGAAVTEEEHGNGPPGDPALEVAVRRGGDRTRSDMRAA